MLGLIIDAVVMMGLVMALNQDSDSPPFLKAGAAAFAISILSLGAAFVVVPMLGLAGLFLVVALAAVIAGAVLWLVFDVPPPRAAIGGVIFLAYKIAIAFCFSYMTSTPGA
jgi:hypothetical protein